jgi:hypothetical protein
MIRVLLLLSIYTCAVMGQKMAPTLSRVPLDKPTITLKSPTKYERRVSGQDPKTGQISYYDPKPEVVLLDARTKKYGLRWVGYDGKQKTVIYQKPDGVDVVASASVERVAGGQFLYHYHIANLQSSSQYLSTFVVQNYSSKVTGTKNADLYVGAVTRNGREFKDGNWIGYGILSHDVTPGQSIELRLLSTAPPGLVECRVAGVLGMKGVGEEMPQELENVLPGYEAWPHGLTLGPHDWLQTATVSDKVTYVRKLVPRMRELGWLTASASRWYEQNLNPQQLDSVLRHVDEDFKNGNITSEVRDLIKLNLK